jgi:hypothetical protein
MQRSWWQHPPALRRLFRLASQLPLTSQLVTAFQSRPLRLSARPTGLIQPAAAPPARRSSSQDLSADEYPAILASSPPVPASPPRPLAAPTTPCSPFAPQYVPPGHFFSPIPPLAEALAAYEVLGRPRKTLPGVALDLDRQMVLVEALQRYYEGQPFSEHPTQDRRYFLDNPAYPYTDGLFLYCMIRYLRPRRIIEVGCGYSSCAILDTNELYFGNEIRCTFVDPYPDLLLALIRPDDLERVEIISSRVQDIPIQRFAELSANDILVIDSTHVSRIGSDVNHLIFEVLPLLGDNVYVHFHDIYLNFEYPREWIVEGRAWNEAYLLRAFLMFNSLYEIVLHTTYVYHFFTEFFLNNLPLCQKNAGGSLWLRRLPGNSSTTS